MYRTPKQCLKWETRLANAVIDNMKENNNNINNIQRLRSGCAKTQMDAVILSEVLLPT